MAASHPPVAWRVEIAPRTIFLILGVVAGVWVLGQLVTVLTVVTVALILVGTFDPVVAWLGRRGLRRGRALVLVFVVASLAMVAAILLMVPPLLSQLLDLIADAPKGRARLVESLSGRGWAKPLVAAIREIPLDDVVARAARTMINYSSRMLGVVGYGISTLFLATYLLADPARSKGFVYAVVPRKHHVKLAKILIELEVIVGGYMRGQLITSLAISVFVFVLLTVCGADNALAIALFAGLTDIIPFVGGYVASTPVILAVTPQGVTTSIIVAVLMVLYQEFESRILVPRVYGRVLRLAPALVLVALLVGGTLGAYSARCSRCRSPPGLQMVIRVLHVGLPGEAPEGEEGRALDDQATEAYEALSEGVSAADAATIADDSREHGEAHRAGRADPVRAAPGGLARGLTWRAGGGRRVGR